MRAPPEPCPKTGNGSGAGPDVILRTDPPDVGISVLSIHIQFYRNCDLPHIAVSGISNSPIFRCFRPCKPLYPRRTNSPRPQRMDKVRLPRTALSCACVPLPASPSHVPPSKGLIFKDRRPIVRPISRMAWFLCNVVYASSGYPSQSMTGGGRGGKEEV